MFFITIEQAVLVCGLRELYLFWSNVTVYFTRLRLRLSEHTQQLSFIANVVLARRNVLMHQSIIAI